MFLHEGLGSLDLWRSFPHDVRAATGEPAIVVYSRHGYGRSDPVPEPRAVTYMHEEADDVLPALLERLGIERPLLVGHSDGASIALLHAGAGRPVAGLVLIAPHVFVEDRSIDGIVAARDAYERTDLRARMSRHHADADATFRGWNDVWLSPAFRSWDITDRLGAIDAPVLLVQGTEDEYGSLAQLDAVEHGVGGPVTRLVLAGTGHAPHLEAPAETLSAVATFVNATTSARQLVVRDATPDDVVVLGDVFRRSSLSNEGDRANLLANPDLLVWTPAPGARIRVADVGGEIAGFAATTRDADELELDDLFVAPERILRGIGRALVDDVAATALRMRVRRIRVTAGDDAVGFYERAGFARGGSVATAFGPAVRMYLDLTTAATVAADEPTG